MVRWIGRAAAIAIVIAVALILGFHFGSDKPTTESGDAGGIFFLSAPAFAETASADEFPRNEVGICAYVNMGDVIELSRAADAFSGIEASESDYIIGTVALPNLEEDMWPHVYISSDGWIMAYYPKTEPTSRIVQWIGYQQDEITTTTLRDTLVQVVLTMNLSASTVKSSLGYYHFQNPNARKLLIALDTVTGSDSFTYTIPSGLSLYEASWSHYASGLGTYDDTYVEIDGERMYGAAGGTHHVCRTLETKFTVPETQHQVTIYCENKWAGTAVVFLHN
ncbi:hypothetical protein ACFLTM_03340 [Candidatus Bipolaricaulota bacterium]